MNNNLILAILCITVPSVLFGTYWYFITKKGKNSLRLFALSAATLFAGGTFIIWYFNRSTWLLVFGLLITFLQLVAPFFWSVTSPEIVKALNNRSNQDTKKSIK